MAALITKAGEMNTKKIIESLIERGYSIKLISSETGISYFKLYRHIKNDGQLSHDDAARLAHFNSIGTERLSYGQHN
jgi:AraC-like DNA-binding protein